MFLTNKLIIYAATAVISLAAITATYYVWKHNVEQAAVMEFNKQQLEQNARDQAEFIRRQEEIASQQRNATRELAEQNRRLQTRVNSINTMINQTEDTAAADVIKRTIERLREESNNR